MANDDLIRSGTASVENGFTVVTGDGVSWGNVREGDGFGAHVGLNIPIQSVEGNVLTLAYRWPGPTQSAGDYAIQPKGDVTRFRDDVRSLLETLSNGTLSALAHAGSSAGTMPFYNGAGSVALATVAAFGLSLLGAQDEASARNAIDALGERWIFGPDTDADSLPAGFARVEGVGLLHFPTATTRWQTISVGDAGRGFQLFAEYANDTGLYFRLATDGYRPWKKVQFV